LLRDVRGYPTWRAGVTVENIAESAGATRYVEIKDGDRIAYQLSEPERDRRFISVITDQTLPFGGSWTFTLEPMGDQTAVRIREDGEIRNPVFRFMARFVFGYKSSILGYLDALTKAAH